MNSVTINLHSYRNNYVFLYNFTLPNFGKLWSFFSFFLFFFFCFFFFLVVVVVEKVVNFGLNWLKCDTFLLYRY